MNQTPDLKSRLMPNLFIAHGSPMLGTSLDRTEPATLPPINGFTYGSFPIAVSAVRLTHEPATYPR